MPGIEGRIGRYEITKRLAYGGMGTLYLAHDPVLERTVALKLFHADLARPDARDRFVREARAAAALNNPNIVTIYDYGEYSSQPFLVMEYIQGETLAELIRRRPVLPELIKVRWMEELCAAVGYAHERGIIHRDIKPANLMIDAYGRVKVLDFGIAQMRGTLVTSGSGLIGTPGYVAPEQIRGGPIDPRSDLFSIGVVCYELFAFIGPFGAESTPAMSERILNQAPTPLPAVQPAIDPDLAGIVARALEKDPERRFESANAMRDALIAVRRRLEAADPDTTISFLPPSVEDAAVAAPPVTDPKRITPAPRAEARHTPPPATPADSEMRTPRHAAREALGRQREQQVKGWLQLARDHIAAGERKEAREACEQVLKIEPTNVEALVLLGRSQPPASSTSGIRTPVAPASVTPRPRTVVPAPASPAERVAARPAAPRRAAGRLATIVALVVAIVAVAGATIWFTRSAAPVNVPSVAVVIDASPWATVEAIRSESDGRMESLPADASTPLALSLAPGAYRVSMVGPPPASERREISLQVTAGSTPVVLEPFTPMTADRYFSAIIAAQAEPTPQVEQPR